MDQRWVAAEEENQKGRHWVLEHKPSTHYHHLPTTRYLLSRNLAS